MPGQDRTGPLGQGSRTGRGLGKCRPKNVKSDSNETISEQLLKDRNSITSQGNSENFNPGGKGRVSGGLGRGKGLGRGYGRNM
ncbi:MAG: DUF5320 domain-containing protein [Bacteroidales bacterium]|nr:DUF5320 domain-containing protein [Bacteroidales bacterium]MCF8458200.1 DUF5320 domain-containing protein [Bacteroidales bacterium]